MEFSEYIAIRDKMEKLPVEESLSVFENEEQRDEWLKISNDEFDLIMASLLMQTEIDERQGREYERAEQLAQNLNKPLYQVTRELREARIPHDKYARYDIDTLRRQLNNANQILKYKYKITP